MLVTLVYSCTYAPDNWWNNRRFDMNITIEDWSSIQKHLQIWTSLGIYLCSIITSSWRTQLVEYILCSGSIAPRWKATLLLWAILVSENPVLAAICRIMELRYLYLDFLHQLVKNDYRTLRGFRESYRHVQSFRRACKKIIDPLICCRLCKACFIYNVLKWHVCICYYWF